MNLKEALVKTDKKRKQQNFDFAAVEAVKEMLRKEGKQEEKAIKHLGLTENEKKCNGINYHCLKLRDDVYHADDIRNVCINYRMRMLPSHLYLGPVDPEFGVKLKKFQEVNLLTKKDLNRNFYIVAPPETFKLEKRERPFLDTDPLLLYKIDSKHYKLVHQWGGDLHPLRRILSWPHRSLTNMTFFWMLITFVVMMTVTGLLIQPLVNSLIIAISFAFLVGWSYYMALSDNKGELNHRFTRYNWNQKWTY